MIGVPTGIQNVKETESLDYSIRLSEGMDPSSQVNITISAVSSKPNFFDCIVKPLMITFIPNATANAITIKLETTGNVIDEGTNEIAYRCTVSHAIASEDPQYKSSPSRTMTVDVYNNDNADVKLWSIDSADDSYGYAVKFLSFYNLEGGSFQYGIRLDTEPMHPVRAKVTVSPLKGGGTMKK